MARHRRIFPLSLSLLPLLLPAHDATARPAHYDLTTGAGLVSALDDPRLRNGEQLRTQDERVMSVIVRDVALAREKITRGFNVARATGRSPEKDTLDTLIKRVRAEVEDVVVQMARTRRVLESIQLQDARSVRIRPSEWALDLNGDGIIDAWEEKFFALPARHAQAGISNPMTTSRESYAANTSRAVIRVDQADVLWMLAYHNFIEGALEFLLCYEINVENGFVLELKDAGRAGTKAAPRIEAGLRASRASMQAALAETHDHEEWLPNPRQQDTAFPLPMDADAFGTWQQVVDGMIPLMQSKTLLAVPDGVPAGGALALCPKGMGLDVGEFWRNPPATLMGKDAAAFLPYCKQVTAEQPVSPLTALLGQRIAQARRAGVGGEMTMLRYLYWIN